MANTEKTDVVSKAEHNRLKQFTNVLFSNAIEKQTQPAKIRLALPDFAKNLKQQEKPGRQFSASSVPLEIAGFQWRLDAYYEWDYCVFYLILDPPNSYDGPFDFEVDCSLLLLNALSPTKNMHKGANFYINRENYDDAQLRIWCCEKMKNLLDQEKGFLHPDGSIHVELDMTIQSAELYPDENNKVNEKKVCKK